MSRVFIEIGKSIRSKSDTEYHILQYLGSGGNSNVYLGLAKSGTYRGVPFAIKIFRRVSEPDRLEVFRREMEFLSECSHPSIMRVYDNGFYLDRVHGLDYPFVVVEYLPDSMNKLMRGSMPSAERASYTLQLLSALAYLAQRTPAVLHRDIKPENIFVKGRSCVLGDFGLMKFVDDRSDKDDLEFFKKSAGPGMPFYYRTPDLVAYAKNQKKITTTKSDVFQLGLVVAEMLTGWNPEKEAKDILAPVELELIRYVLPGALGVRMKSLIERMLEFDENKRPSAAELIDPWEGVFLEIVGKCHDLNGRVF